MFQLNLDYETCLFDKHACEKFENGFERRSQVFPLDLARFPTNTSHRQPVFASIIIKIASDLLHKPLPSSMYLPSVMSCDDSAIQRLIHQLWTTCVHRTTQQATVTCEGRITRESARLGIVCGK